MQRVELTVTRGPAGTGAAERAEELKVPADVQAVGIGHPVYRASGVLEVGVTVHVADVGRGDPQAGARRAVWAVRGHPVVRLEWAAHRVYANDGRDVPVSRRRALLDDLDAVAVPAVLAFIADRQACEGNRDATAAAASGRRRGLRPGSLD